MSGEPDRIAATGHAHDWHLLEVPRHDRVFDVLCFLFPVGRYGQSRRWMVKQPFRRWLFKFADVDPRPQPEFTSGELTDVLQAIWRGTPDTPNRRRELQQHVLDLANHTGDRQP